MPSKWYIRLWHRLCARFFCPFGRHIGTWKNMEGNTWCPNCQQVVLYAPPRRIRK